MAKRAHISRSKSKRLFKSTTAPHPRNAFSMVMRGGTRL